MQNSQGQTIRKQSRNFIRRVIRKCDEESNKGILLHPLKQATARASDYVGVSIRTIVRIRNEDWIAEDGEALPTPGRKRPRGADKAFYCSSEHRTMVRNIIYEFYLEKKIVPSGPKLLAAIREKIDFPWGIHTLRRLLHNMGYMWNRKILIEKPSIVAWRTKYLKAIQYYRKNGRNIIYIDETWVDDTLCFGKCWQKEVIDLGILKDSNAAQKLIIILAGGRNGIVKDEGLVFKPGTVTGDYYDQMNAANFESWLNEKLIPNISEGSVIVFDNAPYHSIQINKPPSKYAKKEDMLKWMVENNIVHSSDMRKPELYEIIKRTKKEEKTFKVDEILKLRGHVTLRLPPHMYDLNPMRLAWAQIKQTILEKNVSILTIDELKVYVSDAIRQVTLDDWKKFCHLVENLEGAYSRKDALVEDTIDNLTSEIMSSDSESDSSGSMTSDDF